MQIHSDDQRLIFLLLQVKLNVEISFFEIYNEKIHDLLSSSTKEKSNKKANVSDVIPIIVLFALFLYTYIIM